MRRRPLGATGLTVSEISLGTWGLSGEGYGPVPEGEAERVIRRAHAMGINLFETAAHYGQGSVERTLGEALKGKSDVVVVTRVGTDVTSNPPKKTFSPQYVTDTVGKSREHLGKDAKLIVLLHNPSERALEGDAVQVLRQQTEAGTIESWGVSVGSGDVARAALLREAPVLSFAYNALQVQPLRELKRELTDKNVGVLVHSVLGYGLLTGRWAPNKRFPYGDHRADRWPPGTLRRRVTQLNALRPLISGDVTSLRSAALRFALCEPVVASAVVGPRSASQLDQLVRDLQSEPPYLSQAKLEALENRLDHLDVPR